MEAVEIFEDLLDFTEVHESLHWFQNFFSPRLDNFPNYACGHYLVNHVALTASGIDVFCQMAGCDSIIV